MSHIKYFTPGPVQMDEAICALGGKQVPYFRNQEFSDVTLECEQHLLRLAKASEGSRAILLTASGTGALEAAVANFASREEKALVINTQGFGQRLVDICEALDRPVSSFDLSVGHSFQSEHAEKLPQDFLDSCTCLMCNAHDTITGAHNDIGALSKIAKKNDLFYIVDAITSFLCDPINMAELSIDVMIAGSQKALALPPGLSVLFLSPRAVDHVLNGSTKSGSYYFDLKAYLTNGTRGQQPFTPAVSIILQLQQQLRILSDLGVDEVVENTGRLANYFRAKIVKAKLPLKVYPDASSNAVTVLEVLDPRLNADALVRDFVSLYDLVLTPNGGALKDTVFRVSHMGVQTFEALDDLVEKLKQYIDNKMENG